MLLQLVDPHLALIERADALQIPLTIVVDLGLADLSGKLNGLGFVPGDQGSQLIQHLKRSLWAAEWGTVAPGDQIIHRRRRILPTGQSQSVTRCRRSAAADCRSRASRSNASLSLASWCLAVTVTGARSTGLRSIAALQPTA